MIPEVLDKTLSEIDFMDLECKVKQYIEPGVRMLERGDLLEKAFQLPLPGKPDESWRRVDLSDLDIENLKLQKADVTVTNLPPEIIVWDVTEAAPEIFEQFVKRHDEMNQIAFRNRLVRDNDVTDNKFYSLALSLSQNGTFIYIPSGVKAKSALSISINSKSGDNITAPYFFIYAEEDVNIDIFITHRAKSKVSVPVFRIVSEKNSNVGIFHDFACRGDYCFTFEEAFLTEDAQIETDFVTRNESRSMFTLTHHLCGENARSNVFGLTSTDETPFCGSKITLIHDAPSTKSDFSVSSVVDKNSKSYFSGNIVMPPVAQKSEGYQENKNLLLGEHARAVTIPQLEIIADDVSCSHGAVVYDFDPVALFYLNSRGLNSRTSKKLLSESFVSSALSKMRSMHRAADETCKIRELFGVTSCEELENV